MISAQKTFNALTDTLTPRQKEVILGRFGLTRSGEQETLAALGKRYGVTRERIRQIESTALYSLRETVKGNAGARDIIERSKKYLNDNGGVATTAALLKHLSAYAEGLTDKHVALLARVSRELTAHLGDKYMWPFYYAGRPQLKAALVFIDRWANTLRAVREEILAGRYDEHLKQFLKRVGAKEAHASTYLSISRKFGVNTFGNRGLTEWPEINPRTIRDRIYLVLAKTKKPLHFTEIARTINQFGLGKRAASAPTVHNELIKDTRFVLVGRGIYALREQGYEPGTAREVIHRILKRKGGMRPKDVILAVQKERFFKPNTVLVNLQNRKFFERLSNGTYQVREA